MRSDERQHWMRTVQVVALTQIAILVGFNFAFPFLPLFIQELGVTDQGELALWTGFAIGATGLVMAAISPLWGLLADRFGRKTMLVRAVGAGSILIALQAVVTSVWQLVAIRLLQGAFTGTQTAGAMLLAAIVPKERTGFALGLLNTAVQLGNLAGPVLGGVAVAVFGLRSSFIIGALLLAICTVITIVFVQDTAERMRPTEPLGVRGGVREMLTPFGWPGLRGVLIVGAIAQVVSASTYALIAIYIQQLARPPWLSVEVTIGLSLALSALAASIALPILGSYSDRHDARGVLVASLAVVGLSLIPQALVHDAVVFLVFRFVLGAGVAGTTAATAVLTRAGAPVGGEGRAFGALATAQNAGWGLGPLLGAPLAAVAGIPALYLASALVILVLVPLVLSRDWFVRPEPVGQWT